MNQPEPLGAGKAHASDITPLLNVLRRFHPLSPAIEAYLNEHIVFCMARKRRLLNEEDLPCAYIYFIVKGAIRGFTREGQKEVTTWINVEDQLVSTVFSHSHPELSIENIEALENCELLALSHVDLGALYERFPEFNLVARKVLQEYFADAERRAFIARLTKAETRYRHFLLYHQQLSNRIPLKYIASYLGMTLETLSRVRKKFSSASMHPIPTGGKYSS